VRAFQARIKPIHQTRLQPLWGTAVQPAKCTPPGDIGMSLRA